MTTLGFRLDGAPVTGARQPGGSVPAFSPADLFTGQTQGGWWRAAAGVWTDAAGTLPAGPGDPVARLDDQSGRGHHLTQPAAGGRPVLSVAGGAPALALDGVDDHLRRADACGLSGATPFTLIFVCEGIGATAAATVLQVGPDGASAGDDWRAVGFTTGSEGWSALGDGEDNRHLVNGGPETHVAIISHPGGAAPWQRFWNGTAELKTWKPGFNAPTTGALAIPASGAETLLGARRVAGALGAHFDRPIREAILLDRQITPQEVADVVAWAQAEHPDIVLRAAPAIALPASAGLTWHAVLSAPYVHAAGAVTVGAGDEVTSAAAPAGLPAFGRVTAENGPTLDTSLGHAAFAENTDSVLAATLGAGVAAHRVWVFASDMTFRATGDTAVGDAANAAVQRIVAQREVGAAGAGRIAGFFQPGTSLLDGASVFRTGDAGLKTTVTVIWYGLGDNTLNVRTYENGALLGTRSAVVAGSSAVLAASSAMTTAYACNDVSGGNAPPLFVSGAAGSFPLAQASDAGFPAQVDALAAAIHAEFIRLRSL